MTWEVKKSQINPHIQTYPEPGEETVISETTRDPWKHRSKGMKCSTCVFYVQKGDVGGFGRCRANAPTMKGYPAVFETDWCGAHRMDEEKLLCG